MTARLDKWTSFFLRFEAAFYSSYETIILSVFLRFLQKEVKGKGLVFCSYWNHVKGLLITTLHILNNGYV